MGWQPKGAVNVHPPNMLNLVKVLLLGGEIDSLRKALSGRLCYLRKKRATSATRWCCSREAGTPELKIYE
jgi:hypothetical protein